VKSGETRKRTVVPATSSEAVVGFLIPVENSKWVPGHASKPTGSTLGHESTSPLRIQNNLGRLFLNFFPIYPQPSQPFWSHHRMAPGRIRSGPMSRDVLCLSSGGSGGVLRVCWMSGCGTRQDRGRRGRDDVNGIALKIGANRSCHGRYAPRQHCRLPQNPALAQIDGTVHTCDHDTEERQFPRINRNLPGNHSRCRELLQHDSWGVPRHCSGDGDRAVRDLLANRPNPLDKIAGRLQ
jgi:hypothetical protein